MNGEVAYVIIYTTGWDTGTRRLVAEAITKRGDMFFGTTFPQAERRALVALDLPGKLESSDRLDVNWIVQEATHKDAYTKLKEYLVNCGYKVQDRDKDEMRPVS